MGPSGTLREGRQHLHGAIGLGRWQEKKEPASSHSDRDPYIPLGLALLISGWG